MSINPKYAQKYDEAYAGIPMNIAAFETPEYNSVYGEENEWWLDVQPMYVPGVIPGAYSISNYGRIRGNFANTRHGPGAILVATPNTRGYLQINLRSVDGKNICCKVARLVLLHFAFIPNCQYYEVDHIDGNKLNNTIWNLEWVTPQENTHRAIINGLRPISCHANEDSVLLTDDQAYDLYSEALYPRARGDLDTIAMIAAKYGVTIKYVCDLVDGRIRPYIAGRYGVHAHIDKLGNLPENYIR